MPEPRSVKASPKAHITIVGAGNLASALAVALHGCGFTIDEILSRNRASSLKRAGRLAKEVGASALTTARASIRSEVVWFCVPDREIASAAKSLGALTNWKGRVALHSSGALTSDELADLRQCGAAVASAHPLMTFVRGSRPPLAGVPFAIEGDPQAARVARTLVRDLGGRSFSIRKQEKEAYHAWGMFVSPLFTALLAASEAVAQAASISRRAAKERMLPILQQTLKNYAEINTARSFSGPIARGDVDTVCKHLAALRTLPEARQVYLALARSALVDLPSRNRAALSKLLRKS
jgi:predicted short-subunit dehydrogenase-like oxidoreductase (DUF2520 family)